MGKSIFQLLAPVTENSTLLNYRTGHELESIFSIHPLVSVFLSSGAAAQQEKFKALLVTKTNESHYGAVKEGISAIKELGAKNSFDAVVLDDPNNFTDKFLEQFRVVIFLCTKDNIFDAEQKQVMERFIRSEKDSLGSTAHRLPSMTGIGIRNLLGGCFIYIRQYKQPN